MLKEHELRDIESGLEERKKAALRCLADCANGMADGDLACITEHETIKAMRGYLNVVFENVSNAGMIRHILDEDEEES